jgi:hypothetical protein
MVFIGADNELPLIEYKDEKSVLCVQKLIVFDSADSDGSFAHENLKKEHKYCVLSWQGCGCGFRFDCSNKLYSDEEFNNPGKQSVEALFEYLRTNVKGNHCEILSFWSGEGISEPNDTINLKNFTLGDSFNFLEGQHLTVYTK